MTEQQNPIEYPLNPHFGEGIFRRRIRLNGQAGKVIAELEDGYHGFRSVVYHDGKRITDIQAEALRFPLTTCGGAIAPIKALIGTDLTTSAADINRQVDPRANCTHLYDLSVLAIRHCLRGIADRCYDISVDDEVDQPTLSTVFIDGKPALSWKVRQWSIIEPAILAGKPLYKGFANWANKTFTGDEQEAAFILQKGYFVAQARTFDMDKMAGTSVDDQPSMQGVCYSYSEPVVNRALRRDNISRDFTHTPEQLLKFL
jgi:hypothetical protein